MKEELLHYIWKFQLFKSHHFIDDKGDEIRVIKPGIYNKNEGPDFLQAHILIGEMNFFGSVEIHLKSSDWNKHKHQHNDHYKQVILHVVYKIDAPIFIDYIKLPRQLEVEKYIAKEIIENTNLLETSKSFIPCQNFFDKERSTKFHDIFWVERLAIERYEFRVEELKQRLTYMNDWPQLFCCLLFSAFGAKVNKEAFTMLGQYCSHKILFREAKDLHTIEAFLFGMAGFLCTSPKDTYHQKLRTTFKYLMHKHKLAQPPKILWKFSRMRPSSFPSIKIAQLAHLIFLLKGKIFSLTDDEQIEIWIKNKINFKASNYWQTHTNFGNKAKKIPVNAGKRLKDNILLNAILPFHFFYNKSLEKFSIENYTTWLGKISPEKNSITSAFENLGLIFASALETQAVLHLHKKYCTFKRCYSCHWGQKLLCDK